MSDNYIKHRLNSFNTNSLNDKVNSLKQVIQEITLNILEKVGFFKEAAFCGGTCLRIFHNLDRFSEDLDFSLISPNKSFDLSKYFDSVQDLLGAYGLNFKFCKFKKTNVQSAFLNGNMKEHLNKFFDGFDGQSLRGNESIRIKLEIDTNPPKGAVFKQEVLDYPITSFINTFDLSSLFAGKVNAIITREWSDGRVKGRDLYDFVYYINNKISLNLKQLKNALIKFGKWDKSKSLSLNDVKTLLINKFKEINYTDAKEDVMHFIKDESKIKDWSEEYFIRLVSKLI